MAEFIFRDMVEKLGKSDQFLIASVATSTEEIWNGVGNPVYPPAKAKLAEHGISCEGKRATLLTKADYDKYDYLIGMDEMNIRNILRMTGGKMLSEGGKVELLLRFAGENKSVADPWYTGNFDVTYVDIVKGCEGFIEYLRGKNDI